ncbi:DUF982 domain-containing protein [Ensifer sp. MJa1]|uniref:DUF982 domain-containing protein n=1 Tax=Ensifer sp. MJa1 TaxID=2919888 RepID=UPI00300A8386
MSEKLFPTPIPLRLSAKRQTVVRTVFEAVELLRQWPARRGREYRAALRRCLDALDGLTSVDRASRCFAAAAREAGLLLA